MTTIADIEALGIEVPKTKEYEARLQDHPSQWLTGRVNYVLDAADAMRDELLAVIKRLVKQAKSDETIIATLRDMEIEATERAEQAEADRKAMTEEAATTVVRLTAEIDEYADQLAAAREERNDARRRVERLEEHGKILLAERDAAREEARKWEWVATHEPDTPTGLARAELEIRSGNYVEWLLARYQPGGES